MRGGARQATGAGRCDRSRGHQEVARCLVAPPSDSAPGSQLKGAADCSGAQRVIALSGKRGSSRANVLVTVRCGMPRASAAAENAACGIRRRPHDDPVLSFASPSRLRASPQPFVGQTARAFSKSGTGSLKRQTRAAATVPNSCGMSTTFDSGETAEDASPWAGSQAVSAGSLRSDAACCRSSVLRGRSAARTRSDCAAIGSVWIWIGTSVPVCACFRRPRAFLCRTFPRSCPSWRASMAKGRKDVGTQPVKGGGEARPCAKAFAASATACTAGGASQSWPVPLHRRVLRPDAQSEEMADNPTIHLCRDGP